MAEDGLARRRPGEVPASRSKRDDEFDLVVQAGGGGRIGKRSSPRDDRRGRLGEEERLVSFRIAAHLNRMVGIVAPDAEDAAHGEEPGPVFNGKTHGLSRRNDEGQGLSPDGHRRGPWSGSGGPCQPTAAPTRAGCAGGLVRTTSVRDRHRQHPAPGGGQGIPTSVLPAGIGRGTCRDQRRPGGRQSAPRVLSSPPAGDPRSHSPLPEALPAPHRSRSRCAGGC